MNSSINLSGMNPEPVHPENALQPLPAVKRLCLKITEFIFSPKFYIPILLLLFGLTIYRGVCLANEGKEVPFAAFKVESLSLVSPQNTWNITLRVKNPRPDTYGYNLSYKVAHVYLSLYKRTIAEGHLAAFDVLMEKEVLVNGTLNAMLSHPEDQILHSLDDLMLEIMVPVESVDPSEGSDAFYDTLSVKCFSFKRVSSSTTQKIQLQTRKCKFESLAGL